MRPVPKHTMLALANYRVGVCGQRNAAWCQRPLNRLQTCHDAHLLHLSGTAAAGAVGQADL